MSATMVEEEEEEEEEAECVLSESLSVLSMEICLLKRRKEG